MSDIKKYDVFADCKLLYCSLCCRDKSHINLRRKITTKNNSHCSKCKIEHKTSASHDTALVCIIAKAITTKNTAIKPFSDFVKVVANDHKDLKTRPIVKIVYGDNSEETPATKRKETIKIKKMIADQSERTRAKIFYIAKGKID